MYTGKRGAVDGRDIYKSRGLESANFRANVLWAFSFSFFSFGFETLFASTVPVTFRKLGGCANRGKAW